MMLRLVTFLAVLALFGTLQAADAHEDEDDGESETVFTEIDFVEDVGGIPENTSLAARVLNRDLLYRALNSLEDGDLFILPNQTFYTLGGIVVEPLQNVKIVLAGTLEFDYHREYWPRDGEDGNYLDALTFNELEGVTLTSTSGNSDRGTLQGRGTHWWDLSDISDDRPKLLSILSATDVVLEKWRFLDSPFWSVSISGADGLTLRYCDAITSVARYRPEDHGPIYRFFHWFLTWWVTRFRFSTFLSRLPGYRAINTDGFDIQGKNVHGHDLYMSTGDDGIAVKGTSSAMLFEYLTIESGLGLAIGSLTTDTVENITFRHAIIRNSIKGIYIKANWYDGEGATVQDVLYENITIIDALQFAVWIGPAQQMGNQDSCTLRWPQFKDSECMMSPAHTFTNITLRDVTIVDPYFSPGVIMGNESNPFTDLRFQNVTVVSWSRRSGQVDPSLRPWGLNYHCSGVSESYSVDSYPSPSCFYSDSDVATTAALALGAAVLSLAAVTLL